MTHRKINLQEPGKIAFFGTMNAAQMMYALELRKKGQDVVYFVDVPRANALSRPENHFPDVSYPYPDWIVEFVLPTPLIPYFARRLTLLLMLARAKLRGDELKAVFLSGPFISFVDLFPDRILKIFFSYGSDFDVWCNEENALRLAVGMRNLSIFKLLPFFATKRIISSILRKNLARGSKSDVLLYFPKEFNPAGKRLIDKFEKSGVGYVPRLDASFEQFRYIDRKYKERRGRLVILSVVRFLYKTFPEGNEEYSKGNDIIIRGLMMYRRLNDNFEVHFFEKGEDVQSAKQLCTELGLDEHIIWHKEVPFKDLLEFYERADICFDQVGSHWIGAGMYALYLGKPLIANASNLSFLGENPILNASTPEEVCERLIELEDDSIRRGVSTRSKRFAEEKLGPERVLAALVFDSPVPPSAIAGGATG